LRLGAQEACGDVQRIQQFATHGLAPVRMQPCRALWVGVAQRADRLCMVDVRHDFQLGQAAQPVGIGAHESLVGIRGEVLFVELGDGGILIAEAARGGDSLRALCIAFDEAAESFEDTCEWGSAHGLQAFRDR